MNELNPPAIVKPAADLNAMTKQVSSVYGAYVLAENANVQRAIEIGTILNSMKELCPHGTWEATLAKTGITSQRASEFMRIANPRRGGDLKTESMNQAIKSVSTPTTPPAPTIYCRPCRVGKPKPNCPDCKKLRTAKETLGSAAVDLTEPDEPTPPKPPKSGAVKFDDRKISDMTGKLARLFNDRAQALGLQKSQGWADIREKLNHLLASWNRWQLEHEKK